MMPALLPGWQVAFCHPWDGNVCLGFHADGIAIQGLIRLVGVVTLPHNVAQRTQSPRMHAHRVIGVICCPDLRLDDMLAIPPPSSPEESRVRNERSRAGGKGF